VTVATAGLRERKKLQTRQEIFAASQRLFARHGFEKVTVAAIAREANVSEMTVFNHFATKEDLFYGGMQLFEEQLLEAVRSRRRGQTVLDAFRLRVIEGASNLESEERAEAIVRAGRIIASSPSLQARERQIVDVYTERLADLLPGDVEATVAAACLMAGHRALVSFTRRRAAAGERGPALADAFRRQARRVFGRLERGLGGYAARA
jgi:AcrR family transcriptional regulator